MNRNDPSKSWKKIESETKYDNPWIEVIHHDVINPAGNPGIYGVVQFKNYALGIIPIDKEGNTWLVGQYRFALDEYSWEIPMGGGPKSVDLLTSAQRELKEETGILAKNWKCIMKLHTSNCVTDEEAYVFIARDLTFTEPAFEETEVLNVKKIPFSEAYKMVTEGKITDAVSVAGILRAADFIQ